MGKQEETKPVTQFAVTTTVPGFVSHAEIISKLREKYHGVTYDVTNATGMAKAVFARRELREARVALDKRKPEVKREALDFCAKVEADYKTIRAAVSEYEDIADEAIKAEEARKEAIAAENRKQDEARIAQIRERIQKLNNIPLMAAGLPSGELEILIARVEAQQIGDDFSEFKGEATDAQTDVVFKLKDALAATKAKEEEDERIRKEQEAEAKRLETLRIEQEKEAAAERERIAAERAELEKLREAERVRQAEADRIAAEKEAELEAERQKLRQEQEELQRKDRERQEKEAAEQAERDRIAREKAEKEAEEKRQEELKKAQEQHEAELARRTADHKTTLESILAAAEDQTLSAPAALQHIIILAKRGLGRKA